MTAILIDIFKVIDELSEIKQDYWKQSDFAHQKYLTAIRADDKKAQETYIREYEQLTGKGYGVSKAIEVILKEVKKCL